MITLIPFEKDDVLAMKIDGKIDTSSYEHMLGVVKEMLERHEKISFYLEILHVNGVSPEVVWEDLKFVAEYKDRIAREAIVSDQKPVEVITKVTDKFLPGIDLRVFGTDEKSAAKAWVRNG